MSVGLDIGSRFVKVVEIGGSKAKPKLLRAAIAEVSPAPIEELEPAARTELTIKAVQAALVTSGIKDRKVIVSLTGDPVIVRMVKFPVMSRDELKKSLQFEAEQYIPFKIDQCVLDFHVVREVTDEGQKKHEVMLVAAKQEAIDDLLHVLGKTGCEPTAIDCDSCSIHNSYEHNHGMIQGETVALLHLGARVTTLSIVEDGLLIFTRDIPIGGNVLTRDIGSALKVEFGPAEELKKTQGQLIVESEEQIERLPDKEDQTLKVFDSLIPTVNKLISEVRRSLDFYEAQSQKRTIAKLVLSGGGGYLKNLSPFMTEKFHIKVEFHEPFKQCEMGLPEASREGVMASGGLYVVAAGLALRSL